MGDLQRLLGGGRLDQPIGRRLEVSLEELKNVRVIVDDEDNRRVGSREQQVKRDPGALTCVDSEASTLHLDELAAEEQPRVVPRTRDTAAQLAIHADSDLDPGGHAHCRGGHTAAGRCFDRPTERAKQGVTQRCFVNLDRRQRIRDREVDPRVKSLRQLENNLQDASQNVGKDDRLLGPQRTNAPNLGLGRWANRTARHAWRTKTGRRKLLLV